MTPRELKRKQKSSSSASEKYKKTRKKKEKFKGRRYGKICEGPDCKKPRERGLKLLAHSISKKRKPSQPKKPVPAADKVIIEKDVTETKPSSSITRRESGPTTVYSQTVGGTGGSTSKKIYEGKASDYDAKKAGEGALKKPGVSKEELVKGEKGVGEHKKEEMVVTSGGKGHRITETKKSSVAPSGEKTLISSKTIHTDKDTVKYDAEKDKITVDKASDKKRKNVKRRVRNKRKARKSMRYW